ncbi:cation transporter [Candidatus Woesearchaeota archaeon]|nr:MAG: cation transporter [Candidatus Woesearchaeota archaeon]
MKTKVYCPDIECESCIKVLTKVLEKLPGIEHFEFKHNAVEVTSDGQVKPSEIVSAIQQKGYRASLDELHKMTLTERFRDFRKNPQKYAVERLMLRNTVLTLLALFALNLFAYFTFLKSVPDFLAKYAWWILYIDVSVVSIGAAIWHIKSYKTNVTSMVGMMIGMTFGMQTGMMLGTIIAATNGLFVGGIAGMVLAVGVGFYNGRCCGIMGIMEGMMAGVMGGVMGSMIGAMFRVDNILWFMPAFTIINVFIMWGLSYMLFEEVVEHNTTTRKHPVDFSTFFFACLLASIALNALIIYGPRTGIAAVG